MSVLSPCTSLEKVAQHLDTLPTTTVHKHIDNYNRRPSTAESLTKPIAFPNPPRPPTPGPIRPHPVGPRPSVPTPPPSPRNYPLFHSVLGHDQDQDELLIEAILACPNSHLFISCPYPAPPPSPGPRRPGPLNPRPNVPTPPPSPRRSITITGPDMDFLELVDLVVQCLFLTLCPRDNDEARVVRMMTETYASHAAASGRLSNRDTERDRDQDAPVPKAETVSLGPCLATFSFSHSPWIC